jgi:hypothetical protein
VRRADGTVERMARGGEVSPGDAIRFSVSSSRPAYLIVLGLDSRPSVSVYVPSSSDTRPTVSGTDVLVDGSIVLDDTLGPERVVALFCPTPLGIESARKIAEDALQAAGGAPERVERLSVECPQRSFLMHKRLR